MDKEDEEITFKQGKALFDRTDVSAAEKLGILLSSIHLTKISGPVLVEMKRLEARSPVLADEFVRDFCSLLLLFRYETVDERLGALKIIEKKLLDHDKEIDKDRFKPSV